MTVSSIIPNWFCFYSHSELVKFFQSFRTGFGIFVCKIG